MRKSSPLSDLYLVEAVLLKTLRAPTRQNPTTLRRDPARQAERPALLAAVIRNLDAIRNHALRLVHSVLDLRCRLAAVERVIEVRDPDDRRRVGRIAAEEGRFLVQLLADEGLDRGDGRHARQTGGLRGVVGIADLGAVGEVVGRVGAVLVDDYDVDSGAVDEGPDWVALGRDADAAVDEFEGRLGGDEG